MLRRGVCNRPGIKTQCFPHSNEFVLASEAWLPKLLPIMMLLHSAPRVMRKGVNGDRQATSLLVAAVSFCFGDAMHSSGARLRSSARRSARPKDESLSGQ